MYSSRIWTQNFMCSDLCVSCRRTVWDGRRQHPPLWCYLSSFWSRHCPYRDMTHWHGGWEGDIKSKYIPVLQINCVHINGGITHNKLCSLLTLGQFSLSKSHAVKRIPKIRHLNGGHFALASICKYMHIYSKFRWRETHKTRCLLMK